MSVKIPRENVTFLGSLEACTADGGRLLRLSNNTEHKAFRVLEGQRMEQKVSFIKRIWRNILNPFRIVCDFSARDDSCDGELYELGDEDPMTFSDWHEGDEVSFNGHDFCSRSKFWQYGDDYQCSAKFLFTCVRDCGPVRGKMIGHRRR